MRPPTFHIVKKTIPRGGGMVFFIFYSKKNDASVMGIMASLLTNSHGGEFIQLYYNVI